MMVQLTQEARLTGTQENSPVRLRVANDGRLEITTSSGACIVTPRRCFPWSAPGQYISFQDENGKEVAFLHDPRSLDAESLDALLVGLATSGFVFEITRILDVEDEVEIRLWTVTTTQGPRRFQTGRDRWPRPLPNGGFLITDVAGDLYRVGIPDTLDQHSRKLLWAYAD